MRNIVIPDRKSVENLINSVFEILFPLNHAITAKEKDAKSKELENQLSLLLTGFAENKEEVIIRFFAALDEARETLLLDAGFILESDPAATELIEVVAIYPGFYAIFCYRIAHLLSKLRVVLIPRMITEHAHRLTGIDIHPSATIGSPFSIDHGTGIVIGETSSIGNNVKIYQGVTIGALSVNKNIAGKKRHPTIEDNVILYAGCTILGGNTVVGRNSIIGGNVWLTESIPPDSVVYHKGGISVRSQHDFNEPLII